MATSFAHHAQTGKTDAVLPSLCDSAYFVRNAAARLTLAVFTSPVADELGQLTRGGKCKTGQNEGGTTYGGTGELATIGTPTTFDVAAIATNGTVKARVTLYRVAGDVEILSWQAN